MSYAGGDYASKQYGQATDITPQPAPAPQPQPEQQDQK